MRQALYILLVSWREFVYDYCLAILVGVDMLFDFRNVGHHLDVAAIDVDFDVVLAHGFNPNKVPDACPVALDAFR